MSGLILKLRPHEQLLVNGVIIENGERKARLRIKSEDARVLRLRDAMRPEEAKTPAKRAYYVAQCAVAGEIEESKAREMLLEAMNLLAKTFTKPPASEALESALFHLSQGQFYLVMRQLRDVITAEALCASGQDKPAGLAL